MRIRAFLLFFLFAGPAIADEAIIVAVASNFSRPAAELSARFEGETGVSVRISSGSTGKLFAQILNGAPYDIFLAADAERPILLEESGHAERDSRFTYARGALVLWSGDAEDCLALLTSEDGRHIALANPETAPYGRAAVEFLLNEGYWDSVSGRAVYGENISQTLQFVATGNAVAGFIARSQLTVPQLPETGCAWEVPGSSHARIEQQAVLLSRAASNKNARRFFEYLRSDAARDVLTRHGYTVSP